MKLKFENLASRIEQTISGVEILLSKKEIQELIQTVEETTLEVISTVDKENKIHLATILKHIEDLKKKKTFLGE